MTDTSRNGAAASEAWARVDRAVREAYIYLDALDRRILGDLEAPLTPAQYRALEALSNDEGQGLNTLAARLLCDKANASLIVNRLVALGLVTSALNTRDRRRVTLALTAAGRGGLTHARAARRAALMRALRTLDDSAVAMVQENLSKLASLLGEAVTMQRYDEGERSYDTGS